MTMWGYKDCSGQGRSNAIAIEFVANGGTGVPPSGRLTRSPYSSTFPDQGEMTRDGYTFLGWSTSPAAEDAQYAPGAAMYVTKSVVFYAIWEEDTVADITITFLANGATGTPPAVITAKPPYTGVFPDQGGLTYADHNFLGWATTAEASTAEAVAGGPLAASVSISYYAVWEEVIP